MIIYISGPMTGYPDFNRPAFHEAEAQLELAGYETISPAHIRLPHIKEPTWGQWMRPAITLMMGATGVATLPNHLESRGSRLELQIARELGMTVRTVEEWLNLELPTHNYHY